MIVFNLACTADHQFEGWFASNEEFDRQQGQSLINCPLCGDANIRKELSAPRLNLGSEAPSAAPGSGEHVQAYLGTEHMVMQQFKQFILANTENVGGDFAETARKMHYGEESHRNIRGRVSREEAMELRDEGIDTMAVPSALMMDENVQ